MRRTFSAILAGLTIAGFALFVQPASAFSPPDLPTSAENSALSAAPGKAVGALDKGIYDIGGLSVKGWAGYLGTPQNPLKVHVQFDGKVVRQLTANLPRKDVATKYPGMSANTGFQGWIPVAMSAGIHTVCVYALRAPGAPGVNPRLGCQTFAVPDSPLGGYALSGLGDRHIHVVGAVADPNSTSPIAVKVRLDGKLVRHVWADQSTYTYESGGKKTVVQAHGRGFDAAVTLPADTKTHQICTTAINAPGTPGADGATCYSAKSTG